MRKLPIYLLLGTAIVCGGGGYAVLQMRAAAARAREPEVETAKVTRGKFQVKVVETGMVDAIRSVDVKTRASGRLQKLLVEEGDYVQAGQLIALVDPQETELQLAQNSAQVRGAQSSVERTAVEIEQRRISAKAAYDQALARLAVMRKDASLQPTLSSVGIRQAEANLEALRLERRRMVENVQPNARTAAESAVQEAKASYDNAKREYDRLDSLYQKGFISGQDLDSARLQLDLAAVRIQSAQDQLNRLEASLRAELEKQDRQIQEAEAALERAKASRIQDAIKRDEVAAQEAAVAQARAALRDVEVLQKQREQSAATVDQLRSVLRDTQRQLRETRIIAPISGIVAKRLIEEGELVTGLSSFSQGTSIVRIEDRSVMRVKLEVNEIDVARMSVGMPATVEVDALPDQKFEGYVTKIAPASTATGTAQAASPDVVVRYQVEINLRQAGKGLRSGMSAKCTLNVVDRDDVLQLPAEFVGQEGDERYVELALPKDARPGTKPERKKVKVGMASGAFVEIISGIQEGVEVQRPEFKGPPRRGAIQTSSREE